MKFFIGTAGWSYQDWVPSFYEKTQSTTFDWLEFYSRYFNCVEVNSTYYAYVSDKIVAGWLRKIERADDFRFTVKLHQDFTHLRKYNNENVIAVNTTLQLLDKNERLGGLLIQFPQSFRFDESSAEYILNLQELFGYTEIFLKVRHGSFHKEDAIKFFKEENINIITIDQPQIGNAISFKPIKTGRTAYFRLHGRNEEEWFKKIKPGVKQTEEERNARYNYLYSPGQLHELAEVMRFVSEHVDKIYVILNNHPKGNAVANAFELLYAIKIKTISLPPATLKSHPRLKRIAK